MRRRRYEAQPTVGETCWIDLSAYLKREGAGGKTVKKVVFEGERFDAVSVQSWRKKVLVA